MISYLRNYQTLKLFIITLFIQVIIAVTLNYFNINFGNSNSEDLPTFILFIYVIVLAPIFETLVFNLVPIKILQMFIKNNHVIIILSSFAFSFIHTYSFIYMIMTYLGGASLNTFYLVTEKKKGILKSAGLTMLIHSIYNLIGFFLIEIFHIL